MQILACSVERLLYNGNKDYSLPKMKPIIKTQLSVAEKQQQKFFRIVMWQKVRGQRGMRWMDDLCTERRGLDD